MNASLNDVEVDGSRVRVHAHVPEGCGAIVVCVHGGPDGDENGPGGLFRDLSQFLPSRGVGVVRFALRGWGDNSDLLALPSFADGVADVDTVIRAVRDIYEVPVVPLGESMGATMLIAAIAEAPDFHPAKLVLLWPALNLFDTDLEEFLSPGYLRSLEGASEASLGEQGPVVGVRFLQECLVLDVGAALRSFEGRALVVHGTSDHEVPIRHSIRAAAILGDRATFLPVDGGDHGLKRPAERQFVLSRLGAFLSE